jgi:Flp pilus assembly pilin Flp
MVEYAMILLLIVVLALGLVQALGLQVVDFFQPIVDFF